MKILSVFVGFYIINVVFAFSECIYMSNVNRNNANVHFYVEDFDEFVYWDLQVQKGNNKTIMQKLFNSKPITLYLKDLDEWTDYHIILQPQRRICVNGECHFFNIENACYAHFKTIPIDLHIDQVVYEPNYRVILTGTTQIYKPERFNAQIEIGSIDDWKFSTIKPNIEIQGVGAIETIYIKFHDANKEIKRTRLGLYTKEEYPVKEEYHSPVKVLKL